MESAAKHILRHGLCIKLAKKTLQNETLEDFVDALPMNGCTSLHKLLEAAGLPPEELGFIDATRIVRNALRTISNTQDYGWSSSSNFGKTNLG